MGTSCHLGGLEQSERSILGRGLPPLPCPAHCDFRNGRQCFIQDRVLSELQRQLEGTDTGELSLAGILPLGRLPSPLTFIQVLSLASFGLLPLTLQFLQEL